MKRDDKDVWWPSTFRFQPSTFFDIQDTAVRVQVCAFVGRCVYYSFALDYFPLLNSEAVHLLRR